MIPASVSSLMSARVRAGPRFGGLSLEGLSLEDLSPGGPLLGAPPVSVPPGFGVVPIPGVGVMLGEVPVPIPGVGVMPVPGLAPVPIPGAGAMKVPPPPPIPPPPIPGEGARAPPVPCARAVLALPAESIAAKTTTNFGCVMIALRFPAPAFFSHPRAIGFKATFTCSRPRCLSVSELGPGEIMSAKSDAPNSEQGGARPLGDNNPIVVAGNFVTDCCDDALMAGAASIADIDRLMDELQRARDFLQSEGERLRKTNASYANLAQTASASAKIIAESLGKWRDDQGNGSRNAMPRAHAPSLTPDQDADAQRKDH